MPNSIKMRRKIEKYEKRINRLRSKMRERSRSRSQLNQSPRSENSEIPEYAEDGYFQDVVNVELEPNEPIEPTTEHLVHLVDMDKSPEPFTEEQLTVEDDNTTPIDAFKEALGIEYTDDSKFQGKILTDIAKRWDHILVNGLNKEEKEMLLKKHKIPENCQLLEAPILNEEVKPAMTEISKLRDQTLEAVQHQLGLATSIVGQVMTSLIKTKDINKVELVSNLTDASKLLNDIHFMKSKTRRNLIAPLLDKNFNNLTEKVKRDEHLYGIDLGSKIKSSQELKKSSMQIKKTSRPIPTRNTHKYKTAGNRYGPPQHNQTSRTPAAPRGGPRNRAAQPSRRGAHSNNYSRPRPERATHRVPYNKH